jgi:hypothetical protein
MNGDDTGLDDLAVRRSWFREPKAAVWVLFVLAVIVGGGRKLLLGWKARKAVVLLENPDVAPEEIEAVAEFGRAGVYELLRIFGDPKSSEPQRHAAGRALSRLWRDDQLIAEEEQAIVRRGYSVEWRARRRYPRGLQTEIPITVRYRVPFLRDDDDHVRPINLEWSHRIKGAGRAALEEDSPWIPGEGGLTFGVYPRDYATNGPHKIVLQSRVRTSGLTDSWQIDLPHMAFSFEFDPILRLDAILTVPDASRDELVARSIRLEAAAQSEPTTFLAIGETWAIRNPPRLVVTEALACDFAHNVTLELDGLDEPLPAGRIIMNGLAGSTATAGENGGVGQWHPITLGPATPITANAIERPGLRRLRAHLEVDPQLGWADPDTRSLWPGNVSTDWIEVEIVRR